MADQEHDNSKPEHPVSQLNMASKAHLPLPSPQVATQDGVGAKVESKSKWNTKNLGLRVAADCVSAAAAATLVAPLISIIDR